jgi:hypothetical protein
LAWESILQEYSEILGNSEFRLYYSLFKQVELLKLNIEMIKICIAVLRKNYSKKFAGELNAMLYLTCKFNPRDLKTYFSELDKCERRIGGLKMNLDLKLIEFEEIKKKVEGGNGKKIDKNYFSSMLITLSRVLSLGYKLNKDIMMNEYCEYYRQAATEAEEANKRKPKEIPRY